MSTNQSQSTTDQSGVPPHNLEAERCALGCCLLDRAALLTILQRLRPDDFFHPPHRTVYEAIRALFNENVNPDYITLTDKLMTTGNLEIAGGAENIAGLTSVVASVRSAENYAKIIEEKAQLRKLVRLGNEMSAFALDGKRPLRDIINWSSDRFLDIIELREHKSYSTVSDATSEFWQKYKSEYHNDEPGGVMSGFPDLDKMLLGFQKGNLIILAARPSQGKTALALDIARNLASRGGKVAFISLEMSKEELVIRLLCAAAPLNSRVLRSKKLSDKKDSEGKSDWKRLSEAISRLDQMKIFIDDSSALTISELRAKLKAISLEQKGLDLIIIDYLQLIDGELGSGDMRVQEVSKISRCLKGLAKELEVPVIALSQLSRHIERREGHKKVPQLSDLRESGAIEQDADVVLFIHRQVEEGDSKDGYSYDPYEPPPVEDTLLIVAKNRNGPIGKNELVFFRHYATFGSSDKPPTKQYSM